MRTITDAEDRLLTRKHRAEHVRVLIDRDGAGDFADVTNLLNGRDFLRSVRWGENIDNPVATATITLVRENYALSLAPLADNSKFNQTSQFIEINRLVRVETQIQPMDTPLDASAWERQFDGRINKIEWGGKQSRLVLRCRDLGGELQDEFIETQIRHGGDFLGGVDVGAAPQQLDTTIQDILDTHADSPPTLLVATTPSFAVNEYLQQKQPIMKAIRTLGMLIAFDVRYRFDNAGGTHRLTLIEPDRSPVGVDREFGPDDYDDLPSVSINAVNIRNRIRVIYLDEVTGVRTAVEVSDAASIARFGPRFMEITEGAVTVIKTSAIALRLANGALAELKDPDLEGTAKLDYFSKVQLMDFYRWTENNVHYSSSQDLAVGGYDHVATISGGRSSIKTTMQLRGKPSMGKKRWLALDGGRPGVASSTDTDGPKRPGITFDVGMGLLTIHIDEPPEPDWDTTEVYLSTATIPATSFPDRPSPGLLVASGRQSRFDLGALVPGSTVFVRAIVVDVKGNFIDTTDLVTQVPETVGVFHENSDTSRINMVPNGDFGQTTKDIVTVAPDGWDVINRRTDVALGVWGTDWIEDTSIQQTGTRSVKSPSTSVLSTRIESALYPVSLNVLSFITWSVRASAVAAGNIVKVGFTLYRADKSVITDSDVHSGPLSAVDTFETFFASVYPNLTPFFDDAFYFSVFVEKDASVNFDLFCDRVFQWRGFQAFEAFQDTLESVPGSTDFNPRFQTEVFDFGGATRGATNFGLDVGTFNRIYRVLEPGRYGFQAGVALSDVPASRQVEVGFHINGTRVKKGVDVRTSAATGATGIQLTCAATFDLAKSDTVEAYVRHTNGSNLNTIVGRDRTYFHGGRVE